MEVWIGLALGLALGAVLARGAVCLNAGLRRAVFEHDPGVLRIFGVALAVELLLLPLLVVAGVGPLERSIDAAQPALLPVAQIAGGLVFGVGMALAGGCIVGILWKTGGGSVAAGVAIGGFVVGELVMRGPGEALIGDLDGASQPARSTLPELLDLPYAVPALVLGAGALGLLLRRRRDGLGLGMALGVLAVLAWLAADAADYSYGLGFVGVTDGGGLPLFVAGGVVIGGALALRGPLRVPDLTRLGRALGGGLLMGAGGSVAHGCNIGHGVTGLGLLSVGSLLAVAAMSAGALLTWRFALRPFPALRGAERPSAPAW